MKKLVIIILVFTFLISMSCKKEKLGNIEEEITKKELVQCDGYRDVKWGMTQEEVEEILVARGLKRTKQISKSTDFRVLQKRDIDNLDYDLLTKGWMGAIIHGEEILGEYASLHYEFGGNGLRRVSISFNNIDTIESETKFKEIEKIIDDKYKNILTKQSNLVVWETSDTVIHLALEIKPNYYLAWGGVISVISLNYFKKELYQEIIRSTIDEKLKELEKKLKEAKEKF